MNSLVFAGPGWRTYSRPNSDVAAFARMRVNLPAFLRMRLPNWNCDVIAHELERTFWEKATILHSEHHRPADKPTPDRFSRHYADTAALALRPIAAKAIAADELRDRVVDWKNQFFASNWARYDLAKPDTFKLVPPPDRIAALRRD